MFNRRQLEILLELCENPGRYMATSYFAQKQQVSLRTIQGDMKAIRNELAEYPCVAFQSVPPKGSREKYSLSLRTLRNTSTSSLAILR